MVLPITISLQTQFKNRRDKIAVIHNDKKITYGTLECLAHTYGSALTEWSPCSSTLIGIGCTRSIETIALLLACTQKGIHYVPLDPAYYSHPMSLILSDAQPSLIITNNQDKRENASLSFPTYSLDDLHTLGKNSMAKKTFHRPISISPDSLFCLIYTSGSTHKPKGIIKTHEHISHQLAGFLQKYDHHLVNAQNASLNFTLCLYQIFGVLAVGGTLVIIDDDVRTNPRKLISQCNTHHISRINFVPHTLEKFLDYIHTSKDLPHSLTIASCTGEPLSSKIVGKFQKILPHVKLLNSYGSTEVGTIGIADHTHQKQALFSISPEVHIKILDGNNNALRENSTGEIAVSSKSTSYANTLNSLSPDTKILLDGLSFFKTGDLGMMTPEGKLVVLGRNMKEIKVNGYRIPFEEINELFQTSHTEIEQSIVLLLKNKIKKSYELVLFFTSLKQIPSKRLRATDLKHLPKECRPSFYIPIEKFLRLSNGKIDLKHLEKHFFNFLTLKDNNGENNAYHTS